MEEVPINSVNLNDFSKDVDFSDIDKTDIKAYHSNVKMPAITWSDLKRRLYSSTKSSLNKNVVETACRLFNYFDSLDSFKDNFLMKTTYREQVLFVREKAPKSVGIKAIGALFGGTEGIVTKQVERKSLEALNLLKEPWRPSIVTSETKERITKFIEEYDTSTTALTVDIIGDFIEELEHNRPEDDSLKKWLFKTYGLKNVKIEGDEQGRVLLDMKRVMGNYFVLNSLLLKNNYRAELTFNADEVGVSQGSFGNKRVLANEEIKNKIKVAQEPREKTSTIMACVSLAGDIVDPMIVVSKKNYKKEINKYFPKMNIVYSSSGFMNSACFKYWLESIFIPYVNAKRNELNLSSNERALLILDNCPSHLITWTTRTCKYNDIDVHWLVPHSSHLTQPLDLLPFGLFKKSLLKYEKEIKMQYTNHDLKRMASRIGSTIDCHIPQLKKELREFHLIFNQYTNFPIQEWIQLFEDWQCGPSDMKKVEAMIDTLESFNVHTLHEMLLNVDVQVHEDVLRRQITDKITVIKQMLINELGRSATLLQRSEETNETTNEYINPNQSAWGHSIGKKICKMLRSFYGSMDSYTIIKGFERVGICSYEDANETYRAYLDLNKCDRLKETFIDVKLTPEWTVWEREFFILKSKIEFEQSLTNVSIKILERYEPDPIDVYPKHKIYGNNMELVSPMSCSPFRKLDLTNEQIRNVRMLSIEKAREIYDKEDIEQTLETIRLQPFEDLKFPKHLYIIQDVDILPENINTLYPIPDHLTDIKHYDGYQDMRQFDFEELMRRTDILRNEYGYPIWDEYYLTPLLINSEHEEGNDTVEISITYDEGIDIPIQEMYTGETNGIPMPEMCDQNPKNKEKKPKKNSSNKVKITEKTKRSRNSTSENRSDASSRDIRAMIRRAKRTEKRKRRRSSKMWKEKSRTNSKNFK